jgi:hypothetical protein
MVQQSNDVILSGAFAYFANRAVEGPVLSVVEGTPMHPALSQPLEPFQPRNLFSCSFVPLNLIMR